ncbi:MAG TPA: tripartite tricarboxylate transporter substrate binding protein [Burkholderiales bacterium]|nr:tripartite tricarboxylate transporter substrate binding protein [Burkholderiales bacterium]
MIRTTVRALACALGLISSAWAQYPSRPIDFIIPLAAGDATDTAARAIADNLARELKVPIVPVNKPGAGGSLGTDFVVKGPKDGSMIGIPNNAALVFRAIIDPSTANYDPLTDLTPLAMAMRSPSILVVGSEQPFKNFKEMVLFSKKNPGKVRIGTAGIGSVGDFCIQTINSATGANLTMVPFKGAVPAVTAMRGGHIEGVVLALGTMVGHLQSGVVRGIVISSKWPDFASIPTMQELGYQQPLFGVWTGIFAPAGVPAEVSNVLVPALEHAIRSPDLAAKLKPLGILAEYLPPDRLVAEMKDEQERVRRIGRQAGLLK